MEKLILEEICSNLKWYEKIIVKIFAKLFIKIYHIGRLNCLNSKIKNNYTKWNMEVLTPFGIIYTASPV